MRVHFASEGDETTADTLRAAFAPVADKFGMRWQLEPAGAKRKVLIMVSKFGHCLNDLLFRARIGELPMDVVAVVSNHTDHQALVEWHGIPFLHVPVTRRNQARRRSQAAGARGRTRCGARGAGTLHAGAQRRVDPASWTAGPSTSTTRSCPASRAPSPTTRPTPAASRPSAPRPTTSTRSWTRDRSSPSRWWKWTTPTDPKTWWLPDATPNARRSPTPSAGTARAGSSCRETAPWCFGRNAPGADAPGASSKNRRPPVSIRDSVPIDTGGPLCGLCG